MITYTRKDNMIIARFNEDWIYSISNYFYNRGISERGFIEKYLSCRTKFYGMARCHPDDKFNLSYGKEIAKERLIKNYKNTLNILAIMLKEKLEKEYKEKTMSLDNIVNTYKAS